MTNPFSGLFGTQEPQHPSTQGANPFASLFDDWQSAAKDPDELLEEMNAEDDPLQKFLARPLQAGIARLPAAALSAAEILTTRGPFAQPGASEQISRGIESVRAPIVEAAEAIAPPPAETLLGRGIQATAGALPQVGAVLASGGLGGAPAAMLAGGALAGGESFQEAQGRGVSRETSALKGLVSGAAGAISGGVAHRFLGPLLAKVPAGARDGFARQVITALGIEPTTEAAQELLEMGTEVATGKEISAAEFKERLALAPLAALGVTGTTGAAGGVLRAVRSLPEGATAEQAAAIPSQREAGSVRAGDLAKSVSRFFTRNLTARKGQPEFIFKANEDRRQHVRADIQEASQRATDLDKAMRSYLKERPDLSRDRLEESIHSYIVGDDSALAPPPELKPLVDGMRARTDEMSRQIRDSGMLSEEMQKTFDKNMGQYQRRFYRYRENPEAWLEKMRGGEEWAVARDFLRKAAEEDSVTVTENGLDRMLEQLILVKPDAFGSSPASQAVGAPDRGALKRRSEALTNSEPLRRLMGEVKDPVLGHIETISHMSKLYNGMRAWQAIVEGGWGKVFFEDLDMAGAKLPTDDPVVSAKEHMDSNEFAQELMRFRPTREGKVNVAGSVQGARSKTDVFVPKSLMDVMQGAIDDAQMGTKSELGRIYTGVNGSIKALHTVYNPQTQMRNLVSNFSALLAGGNLWWGLPSALWHGARVAGAGNNLTSNAEMRKAALEAKRYGVSGGNIDARDAVRYLRDADEFAGMGGPPKKNLLARAVQAPLQIGQRLYLAADDLSKVAAWEIEKRKLRWSNETADTKLSDEQTKEQAAEIVKQTMQNYDRLPRLAQQIRNFPIVGPFASFPAASVANLLNQGKIGIQDVNSSNPRQRMLGAYRLGSLTAVLGSGTLIVQGVRGIARELGAELSETDDEDLLEFAPDYQKDSELIPFWRDGTRMHYVDLSFLDYYNAAKRPLIAAMRAGRWDDNAAYEATASFLQPYLGREILAGAIADIWRGEDEYGNELYPENSSAEVAWGKSLGHLFFETVGGPFKHGGRIYKAATDQPDRRRGGQVYSFPVEVGALLGPRIQTMEFDRRLRGRGHWVKKVKRSQATHLNRVLTTRGQVPPERAKRAAALTHRALEDAYKRLFAGYAASRRQGVSEQAARTLLKGTVNKEDVAALMNGTADPAELAQQWTEEVLQKANVKRQALRKSELADWRRAHPNRSDKDQRERLAKWYAEIRIEDILQGGQ